MEIDGDAAEIEDVALIHNNFNILCCVKLIIAAPFVETKRVTEAGAPSSFHCYSQELSGRDLFLFDDPFHLPGSALRE